MDEKPDWGASRMVRLGISVEGVTEERFIQMVVAPFLMEKSIYIQPVSMGGNVRLDRVRSELKKMAASFDHVTTFYDFYGFKGVNTFSESKETLEEKIHNCVHENIRFKLTPYVQMYEFEGILFSCTEAISAELITKANDDWAAVVLSEFYDDPEKINNSEQTAPSKRLELNTNYRKTTHGPNIAKAIGLPLLRKKCAGFNNWLTKIESLVVR